MLWDFIQEKPSSRLLAIYLVFLYYFAACTVTHKVSRAILKEKDISCHSLRTWLIQRDGIYADVVHFSVMIRAIKSTYVRIICPNSKENAMGHPYANLIFCVCTCQYNASWQSITVIYMINYHAKAILGAFKNYILLMLLACAWFSVSGSNIAFWVIPFCNIAYWQHRLWWVSAMY